MSPAQNKSHRHVTHVCTCAFFLLSLHTLTLTSSSSIPSTTSQVTLPINKHCADPQNEEYGSVAKTTSSTKFIARVAVKQSDLCLHLKPVVSNLSNTTKEDASNIQSTVSFAEIQPQCLSANQGRKNSVTLCAALAGSWKPQLKPGNPKHHRMSSCDVHPFASLVRHMAGRGLLFHYGALLWWVLLVVFCHCGLLVSEGDGGQANEFGDGLALTTRC